jgi:DNA repair protein RadC
MATAKKKINVADIAKLAKKIRKDGERWTDAIKRASNQIKSGK